jgi:hypothetical protein
MKALNLSDVKVEEAIERLNQAVRRSGLTERDLRFRLMPPNEDQAMIRRRITLRIQSLPDGTEKLVETIEPLDSPFVGTINVKVPGAEGSAPICESMHSIARGAKLSILVKGPEVRFYRGGGAIMPFVLRQEPWTMVLTNLEPMEHGRFDARYALQEGRGIRFYEGARAEFLPGTSVLETYLPHEENYLLLEPWDPSESQASAWQRVKRGWAAMMKRN